MIGQRISAGKRKRMAICSKCLHKEVCSYKRIYDKKSVITCKNFLGWVKVIEERPEVYKDVFIIDPVGLPFVGYYNNFRDRETFTDINTLQTTRECPSYWLKGLDLYGQSMVARKEAESVLQTISDADES